MSNKTSLRRVPTFICGVAVGLFLLSGVASAAPQKDSPDNTSPQPASKADFSGNGANQHGAYDSTRDGSPSGNGNGGGEAKGKPCAGCVGKADNKNPKGQAPDGSDHNKGYECDGNHGIGRSNPAHTGCVMASASAAPAVSGDTAADVESTVVDAKPAEAAAPSVEVAGVSLQRAAPSPAPSAQAAASPAAVLAAAAGRADEAGTGIGALPLTGAGAGVLSLALVAMALLGTGLVLVRRSRPVSA